MREQLGSEGMERTEAGGRRKKGRGRGMERRERERDEGMAQQMTEAR